MNRRSLLHRVTLIAIFSAVFSASGANAQTESQPSASFRVVDQIGKPAAECPLKHTAVKAEVSGFISRVTVTQNFENPFTDKIEAVYTFPLPEMSAVDDLTMQIGDRTIKGKIMRREDASAAYGAARQMGKIASLLDQQRANIFTQQVANILPGQQIRITISYVETLKYEDGSYQWSFPMVVAPRYDTAGDSTISPPRAPEGMRAGHDVSLEINIDAGVPISSITSTSHELDVQQINEKRAVVRLKDHATIPNKDFLLAYSVGGDTIKDAVLAHHSDRGGFFTLILQPPQRVQAEDVMPKEMVFILDTSGSMAGSPIDTAKKTMLLALDTLYPHDTFNLITFSGDTEILFSQPVPATPENLRKAKRFLSSREGNGGTELMKAVKAALDPSDSQYHVRLACFMTDGQVGNDDEILEEVQKHRNARVFAMGFGDAPNRALLDKMTQYGRGEVDYISLTSNSSTAARRFNNRIRNPLLTDVSIEWSDLSITEVYPKRIPDLFSAKPVIISGRYTTGGKGTIRLKGKMGGQDFVRDIPVELPEVENDHEALGTLWARHKIDDLTAEEIGSNGNQILSEEKRREIAELGVTFKLMTPYTSFVAVDEELFTGSEDPRRVDVTVEVVERSTTSHSVASLPVSTSSYCDSSLQFTPTRTHDLPLQGRSFTGLLTLTPGTTTDAGLVSRPSRITMNGQSTNLIVDGVNVNVGITGGGESPGTSASGTMPAVTASGGANGIVTLDVVQELVIGSSSAHQELGRADGPTVIVNPRNGTNTFHGSVGHYFGNDAFDAGDWFANARGLNKPPKRLNIFGGNFNGPIRRDKTFFYGSYEGLRLRQPVAALTDVPSVSARQAAPDETQPFLEAFPIPTSASRPDGFAEFATTFSNPARHDVGSLRIDHSFNFNYKLEGRYNFADSDATRRGANGFSLSTTNRIRTHAHRITGAFVANPTSTMVAEFRANYSRTAVNGSYALDQFGGATIPAFEVPIGFAQSSSFAFDLNSRNAAFMIGDDTRNIQRQINLIGSTTKVIGNHTMQFGGDYRRLSPIISMRGSEQNVLFDGVDPAMTGSPARVNNLFHSEPQTPLFKILSLYGQDQWRPTSRLTLAFGLRWVPDFAPDGDRAVAVDQVNNPETVKLAAAGTPLWETTVGNFAPNVSFAYQLLDTSKGDVVLRGGANVVYDRGQDRSADVFANSLPFISGSSTLNSSFSIGEGLPLLVFDPQLKLPYSINWNVSLQKIIRGSQYINVAYIGSSRKRLLDTETLFDRNPAFPFLRITSNRANSTYRALHLSFERSLRNNLAALVMYSWSHATDNSIYDSDRKVVMRSVIPELDYGPSDFHREHELTGFIQYDLPSPFSKGFGNTLFRKWRVGSIFNAHSAQPFNVFYMVPTSIGVAYFRPDIVDGASLYVSDPDAPGGRRINRAAFSIPATLRHGTLTRNSLRGFPFYQIDLGLRRNFNFTDDFLLQFAADAFNLFNRTNFEDPLANDLVLGTPFRSNSAFGESTSLSGRDLSSGGFASFYGRGGARTLRFSVKLVF